jgi:nicotinate-nucleotide adenylyltransferase
LARFVGVSRPGYELDGEHIAAAMKELPTDALSLVEVPALAISSSDCRRRAEAGRPIWYLVPDGVVQYVTKRGLYPAHTSLNKIAAQTANKESRT